MNVKTNLNRAMELNDIINDMNRLIKTIDDKQDIALELCQDGRLITTTRNKEILEAVKDKAKKIIDKVNKEIETL